MYLALFSHQASLLPHEPHRHPGLWRYELMKCYFPYAIITPSNALLVYCDVTTTMNRIVKEVKLGCVFLPYKYLSILLGLQNILVKVRDLCISPPFL